MRPNKDLDAIVTAVNKVLIDSGMIHRQIRLKRMRKLH